MTRICVIGNFSGRNAGDVAILGGVLKDISDRYSGCIFIVPTINPQFIKRTFPEYDIEAVGLLPWNLSIKIFGWPILCSVLSADLVLITDAILFDYKLMNPLYNYLSTMAIVLPLARRKRIPVVLYNVSLGPIYSRLGKICMRRVLESSKQILVRDNESLKMLKALDLTGYSDRIIESADSALNAIPSDTGRLNEMIRKEDILTGERSWVSVNISSYIDVYVRNYKRKGIGREKFLNMMAKVIDRIVSELMVNVVLVITQPMDLTIAGQLLNKLKDHSFIRMISNKDYSYQDLTAVFMSVEIDRKSTRLNSSHIPLSRMPSSA